MYKYGEFLHSIDYNSLLADEDSPLMFLSAQINDNFSKFAC